MATYYIHIVEQLDQSWLRHFPDLTITQDESGHPVLSGTFCDYMVLREVLDQIYVLGLSFVSITRVEPD